MTRSLVYAIAAVWLVARSCPAADPGRAISFNRDVRPILADACFQCHGPDANARQADLRLDTADGLAGSAEHPGVVRTDNPHDNGFLRRIMSTDPDVMMPPPSTKKTLSDRDRAILRSWIEQGAPFEGHWSYMPLQRPAAPAVDSTNLIDQFLAARLSAVGLSLAAEADRRTLARRLALDLTGLPPDPDRVGAFVTDERPDAYERYVDELLASPRYGERMAVYWLDLVRFADTIGYHSDTPRDITPYRDYVIAAFNENLPFDQFTREQLAGDLLPDAGQRQKVAAGYNRLLQTTEEGGAQPKEYAAKYLADRVRNVSSVWLAGTMACCECHNHKYDPYTQQDFYSLAAFFADIQETPVGRREPGMLVPTEDQRAKLEGLEQAIAAAQQVRDAAVEELLNNTTDWSTELSAAGWEPLRDVTYSGTDGLSFTSGDDGTVRVTGTIPDKSHYEVRLPVVPSLTGLKLQALAHPELPSQGPGHAPNGNFVLSQWTVSLRGPDGVETPVALTKVVADHVQTNWAIQDVTDDRDGTGWAVLPQTGQSHTAIAEWAAPLTATTGELVIRLKFASPHPQHSIGHFRLTGTTQSQPTSRWLADDVAAAMQAPPATRTPPQRDLLAKYLRETSPRLEGPRTAWAAAIKSRDDLANSIPRSLTVQAMAPATVRILARGNWMDDSGTIVQPAIPAFLGKLSVTDRRPNRRDLAEWLVAPENPLTPRVMVNRLWKLCFGVGLSKTVEDLGSQGEWPTHPELLDGLAVEFRDSGWNVKRLLRTIVTSRAYRQSSILSTAARNVDPQNRLLSAQNRYRLEAEFVRDNALQIAGLLSPRIGGESVKPYQPDGYWDYLNFPKRTYPQDHGERLYRRGLYTHWQRSFLHPQMLIFDAPSREECVAERPRSNTPQQALTLLNDPAYLEAARVFAMHALRDGGETDDARLAWAYRRAMARDPRPAELAILRPLLDKHRAEYAADPAAAEALLRGAGEAPVPDQITPAELAAWTSLARVILNLHETLTRL